MTTIRPEGLGDAIGQLLTTYHEDVLEKIDAAGDKAVKDLVKKTKATAPVGARRSFKKNITSKRLAKTLNSATHVWYVKAPDHRLTHLLVHGHAKKNGGRTRANPFLQNALGTVLPEYEKAVEEAVKSD